ncbi:MAG: dTMP kinase [Candidatus Izemoplasmatales bacterium]|nr:dTMP kinase [Candidatus Izemoplasmatales bacterium]
MKGLFVSFEGTEGSGKTSIIRQVSGHFSQMGIQVVATREPGGIRISEMIRDIVLGKANTEMDPRTEALLFAASRRQHLVEKIIPALTRGDMVLCDRFVDSSLVYQGIARKLGFDEVLQINQFAIQNIFPDLTILIDVRPEVGLSRVFNSPGREVNRMDLETIAFYNTIYNGYKTLLKKFPHRMVSIDGEGEIEEVAQAVIAKIETILAGRK